MQAVIISRPGGAEVLRIVERPAPELPPGHVLLRVAAAGVNRADILQRQGKYPPPPGAPVDIPGLEAAGEIIEAGDGCVRYRRGDRVMALLPGGGYAGLVAAPESLCLPVPDAMPLQEAAALPEAIFTVWANLFVAAGVQPGEAVLVHGGASGIGSMAIMMLRAHGAIPYATAGDDAKSAWCRELGAEEAVNYRTQDFAAAIRAAAQGRGMDVILDMVGGDYLPRNIELLADHGRLVWIATQRGASGATDIRAVMRRRSVLTGATLRGRSIAEKAALAHEIERRVMPWLAEKTIKSLISHKFPINMAAEAHKTMESGLHRGKIVLDIAA